MDPIDKYNAFVAKSTIKFGGEGVYAKRDIPKVELLLGRFNEQYNNLFMLRVALSSLIPETFAMLTLMIGLRSAT